MGAVGTRMATTIIEHCAVTDSTGNVIVGSIAITAYPCDSAGGPVLGEGAQATGWAATWAPTGGPAISHAPVYSHQNSGVFDTPEDALEGARRGVDAHYPGGLRRSVR